MGNAEIRSGYDRDRLHGEWQWVDRGKVVRTIRYQHGELLSVDGVAVDDPLGRALAAGQIDDVHLQQMLTRPAEARFHSTLLETAIDIVSEIYQQGIGLDRRALYEAKLSPKWPISLEKKYLTSGAMLALLLEPHGLTATYRFGMIWITTKDNARSWVDRTGVATALESPPPEVLPSDRERIRVAFQQLGHLDFVDTPLQDVAGYLSETYRVPIACEMKFKDLPVTDTILGVSLQNALAAMCDQHGLRVRWRDGKTLVIEPQEGAENWRPRR
jgi:hypothetical protein